jgi:hypothetical protein
MAENHCRRITHFGDGSVFIAILPVVIGSVAMTEGVMRPTVNDSLADERPVFIEPFRIEISESVAANVFIRLGAGCADLNASHSAKVSEMVTMRR